MHIAVIPSSPRCLSVLTYHFRPTSRLPKVQSKASIHYHLSAEDLGSDAFEFIVCTPSRSFKDLAIMTFSVGNLILTQSVKTARDCGLTRLPTPSPHARNYPPDYHLTSTYTTSSLSIAPSSITTNHTSSDDLFTQILDDPMYLGNDEFIKEAFCQLVDAVV